MSSVESSNARQRALWRVGAALSEARLGDVDATLDATLERLGRTLGVAGMAIYRTELTERTTMQTNVWIADGAPDAIRDVEVRAANDAIVEEMFANEGIAVLPLVDLAGERVVTPGWENGSGLLALVDLADEVAYTLTVIVQEESFDEVDTNVIRAFASMLRQFFVRIRVERDLQDRLELEDFVAASIGRLASCTSATYDAVVDETLDELLRRFEIPTAHVMRIGRQRVATEVAVGDALPEAWNDFAPVGDGRFVKADLSPGFHPLASMAKAFFDGDDGGVAGDDPREVAVFPTEVGDAVRTCIALIGPPRDWSSVETDAIATIGAALAQTRARLAAEQTSRYRHALQAEIAALAADFLWVRADDVDEVINDALRRVARQFGATAAFVVDLRDQKPGRAVVRHAWGEDGAPFTRGQRILHPRGWESSLENLEPRTGVLPFDPRMEQRFRDLLVNDTGLFSLVSVPLQPTSESTPVVGIALPGDHSHRFATITEMAATFADLLSQLNSRLALESAEAHRSSTQLFLREAAATLAEAADTDYHDAVTEVLGAAADFLDLDELSTWQVDQTNERYVARQAVGGSESSGSALPFGVDAVMDDARTTGTANERQEQLEDGSLISTIALRRGDDDAMTVTVACRIGDGALCEHERSVLNELNHLFGQIEERIAGERYSQTAFGEAPIGIVLCDRDWRIITCNPAFARFVGYGDAAELVGVSPDVLLDTDDRDPVGGTHELPLRRKDGRRVWTLCHSTAIEGVLSGEPMWLVHVEDITERRRADQLLRFQATHDELTGLANRRELRTLCDARLDGAGSTAILLLDLDRFKLINDSLGHDRGDDLLIAIADRLRLAVRPGDVVARLGGDEFAVLLHGPVDNFEAGRVADRLLRLLGEPMTLGSQQVFPSASIGIAVADVDSSVADLLRRADTAMYRAKAGGRGRHEAFDEDLRDEVRLRMETEAGLRRALRNRELVVHYQPEVSLRTGRTLGAEALVRWAHPMRGLLLPGAFIEVAEETGLIIDLGTHVLFEACNEAAGWADPDLAVRVNFAAAQLQRNETIALVEMALAQSGLAPHRLCVEITESAMMGDVEQADRILTELKERGVRVAVDDFGTGFSSLAYLKRFPVDALKIDRAFVSGLGSDEDNAFVRSIISLAEALGLDVVAEGVETEDQVEALLRLGCHRAQGFHFARPAPAEALRSRLAAEVSG